MPARLINPKRARKKTTSSVWRRTSSRASLPEVHGSIAVPRHLPFWKKMWAYSGPGFLVAVGYMDPGNWATDLAGGAKFGYTLLFVIMMSNLMAILLQHLCIKLGVATGRDLAQACRDHYSTPTVWFLWILCELAIAACDLAEVVGSAIGLQLLFGIPAGVGLPHHGAGRAGRAVPAEQGLSLRGGAGGHAHSHHRAVLCAGVVLCQAEPAARCCAASCRAPRS